jgi:hypothetical protein
MYNCSFTLASLIGVEKLGPSGARIEFRVGGEYAVVAADTFVDAIVLAVVVLA